MGKRQKISLAEYENNRSQWKGVDALRLQNLD